METVTREDLAKLLLREDLSFEEALLTVKDEFRIPVPPEIETSEALLEHVYNYYIQSIELYQLASKELYKKEKSESEKEGTKKEFIVNYIITKKDLTLKELHDAVDEEFEYSKIGKSPRTRCRKVIQQLRNQNKIKFYPEEKRIVWKGK